jgi:hypothetical protein
MRCVQLDSVRTLDHQGVDVDKADLQQVERQHGELLVFQVVGSDLAAFAVDDELLASFQFSMTLRPSWISRRSDSECGGGFRTSY